MEAFIKQLPLERSGDVLTGPELSRRMATIFQRPSLIALSADDRKRVLSAIESVESFDELPAKLRLFLLNAEKEKVI